MPPAVNVIHLELTPPLALKIIRDIAQDSARVSFTDHALKRMRTRQITTTHVIRCLRHGRIAEGPAGNSEAMKIMHHYTACGLRNVWLRNGYAVRQTAYGRSVAIHDLEGLHKMIGLFLANDKPRLTGAEVRFLRKELDMSQSDLAHLLGVSESSLRGWEKNRTRITTPAERLLRHLYREHVSGNGNMRALIDRISQLNRDMHVARLELEETERGWRAAS